MICRRTVSLCTPTPLNLTRHLTLTVSGWGFKRLHQNGPDHGAYYHERFLWGIPDTTCLIRRLPPRLGKQLPDKMNELDFYFVSKHFPLPRNNESKPRKKSLLQRVDASFRKTLLPVGVSPDGAAWNDKAVEAVAEINQFVQKAIEESAARGTPVFMMAASPPMTTKKSIQSEKTTENTTEKTNWTYKQLVAMARQQQPSSPSRSSESRGIAALLCSAGEE